MKPSGSSPRGSRRCARSRPSRCRQADGRILAGDISAPLPLPPFTNSAVDGYAVRSGDLPRGAEAAFAVTGRVQAGASAGEAIEAGPRGADLHRRADAGGRRHGVHAGGRAHRSGRQGCSPGGPESRRQCASRRGRHSRWFFRARERPAVAAAGCRAGGGVRPDPCRCDEAHPGRGVLDRQRTGIAGRAARRCAIIRFQPLHADGDAGPARLRGQRSRHSRGTSALRWLRA